MHACLLDVLHDASNQHIFAITDRIDIDLDGIIEESIKQYRSIVRDFHRCLHIVFEVSLVMHDLHRTATEHIRGTND